MVRTVLSLLLLGAPAHPLPGQGAPPPSWRWSSGAGLGVLLPRGELGRDRNATGAHEELIARGRTGAALGVRVGREARLVGFELSGILAASAVQVRNEFGTAFPNHGDRPFSWTAGLLLYPLAPLQPRNRGLLHPFLMAGLGGTLVAIDLDNVKDKTLYHSFHWGVGAGIRIATSPDDVPTWTPTFLELRVSRLHTWSNGPLRGFELLAVTAGVGMRF